MHRSVWITAGLVAANASAFGQTGSLVWQANDGRGWTSNRLETTSRNVEVRLFASWNVPTLIFGSVLFDGRITTPSGSSDELGSVVAPWFPAGGGGVATPSRFGSVIKIDSPRDTLPPGEGELWARTNQIDPGFGQLSVSDNPLGVLSFAFALDATPGTRTIDMLFQPNRLNQFMVFTGPGSPVFINAAVSPLDIVYIPTPASASLLALTTIIAARRRR